MQEEKIKINTGMKISVEFLHEDYKRIGIIESIPMAPLTDLRIVIDKIKYRFQYMNKTCHSYRLPYFELCEGFLIKGKTVQDVLISVKRIKP